MSSRKKTGSKPRNWLAVHAHLRGGAGVHASRKPPRPTKKQLLDDWDEELLGFDKEDERVLTKGPLKGYSSSASSSRQGSVDLDGREA